MSLLERAKRTEAVNNSSFTPICSFEIVARFCANLVQNTVASDDHEEIGTKGQREEDTVANLVLNEVFRSFADRIAKPKDRL